MRAVILTQFGGPEVLAVREVPEPEPRRLEVLVRVRGTALNRADILQRLGRYPAPNDSRQDIPGLEFAGEVVAVGPEASRWRPGDRVFGLVSAGAHAQYLAVHQDAVAEIPPRLGFLEAAALPEALITAHDALITQAGLQAGESVLVHAVGSGVGLAAVQIVRAWNAIPYGTTRTADKLARARTFGLEDGIALPHGPEALRAATDAWTSSRGINVVLDLVGGAYASASVNVLAARGRLLLVGTVAGGEATIDLRRVLGRRLTLRGTVMRSRSLPEKIEANRLFERDVVPLVANGRIVAVIDSAFELAEIASAHRRMESNETFGKVVVAVD